MAKDKRPTILGKATLAKTRLFHVEQVDLEFSNGVQVQYERLLGSPRGAVLVVPVLDDDTLLLIREYAVGLHRYELGFPKGRIEGEESVVDAANREIQEEIGYAATELQHLSSITLAPGYSAQTTHVVLAQGLYPEAAEGDEPEELEVVPWKWSEMQQLLACEDFTEARSIAALFMARESLLRARD